MTNRLLCSLCYAAIVLAGASRAEAVFIGNLDGVSNSSTFEVNGVNLLPDLGWANLFSSARAWDANVNGMMISTDPYSDYEVEYLTTVAIEPNTTYTLTFDMGYAAALTGGNSGYSFLLGTYDGGGFTALGPAETGNVPFAGDSTGGSAAYSDSQVYVSGPTVSGDNLAVRWAQVSTLGSPFSDFFGFDNVTLDAEPIAALAVPEPATATLILLAAIVPFAQRRRACDR